MYATNNTCSLTKWQTLSNDMFYRRTGPARWLSNQTGRWKLFMQQILRRVHIKLTIRSHPHLLTLSWVIYLLLNTASQNCFDKAWAQIKTSIIHNGRPWSSTHVKYSALDLAYLVKWNQWNNPKSTNSAHPTIPQVFESWHTGMYLTMSASEGYSCDKNECWESGWDSGWVIRLKSETTYVCVISSKTLQFLNYNISHPCPS